MSFQCSQFTPPPLEYRGVLNPSLKHKKIVDFSWLILLPVYNVFNIYGKKRLKAGPLREKKIQLVHLHLFNYIYDAPFTFCFANGSTTSTTPL